MGPSPALVLTLTLTLTLPLTQVGPSPALIRRAAALPCRLAWSVHAADNALRRALVPTTRHTMEELREAFSAALAAKSDPKQRGLLVEVALLMVWNRCWRYLWRMWAVLYLCRRKD